MIIRRDTLLHIQNRRSKYNLNDKENVLQTKGRSSDALMKLSPAAKLRGFVKQPLSVKQALVEKNIQATQNNKSENIATSEVNLLKIPKPQSRLSHAQPPSLPTYNKPTAAATNTVVSTTSITTTTTKPTAQNNTESHSDKLREYLARRNDRINNTIKSTIASTTTKSVSSNQSVGSEKRPNTSRTLPTKKLPTIPHPSSTAKTSTNSFIQKVEPNHISITPKNRLHPVVTFPTISNPSKSYEKGHLDCKKMVAQNNSSISLINESQKKTPESSVPNADSSQLEVPEAQGKAIAKKEKRKRDDIVEASRAYDYDRYEYDLGLMTEYSNEIFDYMRQVEESLHPDIENLMQTSDCGSRFKAIEMIVHVCDGLNSLGETLHLAVHLFDRAISKRAFDASCYFLLALTCVFIAWKYEERCHLNIYVSVIQLLDSIYPKFDNRKSIREAEVTLLQVLDFNIGWPGPLSFLRRCSRADDCDQNSRNIAKYVLEQVLIDPTFLKYKPSLQAAAAMFIGRKIMGRSEWGEEMIEYSGYTFEELNLPLTDMSKLLFYEGLSATCTYKRYNTGNLRKISTFVNNWMIKNSSKKSRSESGEDKRR